MGYIYKGPGTSENFTTGNEVKPSGKYIYKGPGVNLDDLEPLPDESRNYAEEFLSGATGGVLDTINQAARISRRGGVPEEHPTATRIIEWTEQQEKNNPFLRPSIEAQNKVGLHHSVYEGTHMMLPSLTYAAPGVIAGGLTGGLPGAAIGAGASSYAAMYAAEFDAFHDDVRKFEKQYNVKLPDDAVNRNAHLSGMVEGFGEALGSSLDVVSAKYGGRVIDATVKPLIRKAMKKTAEDMVKEYALHGVLKNSVAKIAKNAAGTALMSTPGEVGTEMAQSYYETKLRNDAGLNAGDPIQAAKDVVGPTAFMTAVFGVGAAGFNASSRRAHAKALADQNANVKDRIAAVREVGSQLHTYDKKNGTDFAQTWTNESMNAIVNGLPIELDRNLYSGKSEVEPAAESVPQATPVPQIPPQTAPPMATGNIMPEEEAPIIPQAEPEQEAAQFTEDQLDSIIDQEVNKEPSDAQIKAGNYKKAHLKINGMDISIENPKDSTRSGVDKHGRPWENRLAHHYGYILGTRGKDKDHLDVFVGPNHQSDKAFVIDQVDPETGKLDEHKILIGFDSTEEARQGYLDSYQKGWKGLGNITETTVPELKDWMKNGDMKKPFGSITQQEVSDGKEGQGEGLQIEQQGAVEAAPVPDENLTATPLSSEAQNKPDLSIEPQNVKQPVKEEKESIGKNSDGTPLFEDEKGNRYYTEGKIRHDAPILIAYTRQGVQALKPYRPKEHYDRSNYEFLTKEELEKFQAEDKAEEGTASNEQAKSYAPEQKTSVSPKSDRSSINETSAPEAEPKAELSKPDNNISKESTKPELTIEPYSEKSFVVRGNTKAHVDRIKKAGKGLFSLKLKGGPGWVFGKSQEAKVREALKDLLEAAPAETKAPVSETKPAESETKKPEIQKSGKAENPSASIADKVVEFLKQKKMPFFTSKQLFEWADEAYGGSQSEGKYTVKDAYDAMELGINKYLEDTQVGKFKEGVPEDLLRELSKADILGLKKMLGRIPTQANRTEEMATHQQFSTPPSLAYLANWVANIKEGEAYLEPSAGIGGLAVFGKNAGAKVYVNELSERRLDLLKQLDLDGYFNENAELLDNILPARIKPTVIVMNPPFSATAGRMKTNKTLYGGIHVEQALKRLEPGGRLVAIVGKGMADDAPAFREWWSKIKSPYNVRANVGIDGEEYKKYGTSFDNQIIVIDKTGPSANNIITGKVNKIEDLVDLLMGVRNDRTYRQSEQPERIPEGEQRPAESGVQEGPAEAEGESGREMAVLPPARDVGSGTDRGRGTARQAGRDAGGVESGSGNVGSGAHARGRGNIRTDQLEQGNQPEEAGGPGVLGTGERPAAETSHVQINREALETHKAKPAGKSEELSEALFTPYKPAVTIKGSKKHPGNLVESAAMSALETIPPKYVPNLPKKAIQEGRISDAQLEVVINAGQAHSEMVAGGEHRRGYFIGDGTGVGKGREISAILWDNWNQGRKKAVWISKNTPLFNDAKRDIRGVGWDDKVLFDLSKTKLTAEVARDEGIAFLTYDTLKTDKNRISAKKLKNQEEAEIQEDKGSRLNQLVKWLGKDFDGVIAFDESHSMRNAIPVKGKRGMMKPSEKALAGLKLQNEFPNARIVYVSATGATEVSNLAYALRLGLWGAKTAFASVHDFINQIQGSGVAAMEAVARDLKSMGLYLARSLSYHDVKYDRLEHSLTPQQREIYDELAGAWDIVLDNMNQAMQITGITNDEGKTLNKGAKSAAMSRFWGTNQRFWNQIITSMQMPSLINAVEQDLKDGHSVVMQLVNTNEAEQNRAIARLEEDESLEDLDMTPRQALMEYVDKAFPVVQMIEKEDQEGHITSEPARDSQGNYVLNHEAVALKDELLTKLGAIRVPDGPLEMILDHFGPDKVSEVTGRTQRVVKDPKTGNKIIEKRSPAKTNADADAFADDRKRILVFSDAGGTGRSYHAGLEFKNQRMRKHYLIQPGWRADNAVQGFGRTHRSNQKQSPHYVLVHTDLKGHKRFLSSIARRLDQLGALTKGQRETGSQGFFQARDNLESHEARTALRKLIEDLYHGKTEDLTMAEFMDQTGLRLLDEHGVMIEQLPEMPQFLNRLLNMKIDMQEKVFNAFSERLDKVVAQAIANGTLDMGIQTVKSKRSRIIHEETVYTDPKTGAETKYIEVELTHDARLLDYELSQQHAKSGYVKNIKSGRVWALGERQTRTDPNTGKVDWVYQAMGANYGRHSIFEEDVNDPEKYEKIPTDKAQAAWDKEYGEMPHEIHETKHLITGVLLPIWDRLPSTNLKINRIMVDGKVMIGRIIEPSELKRTLDHLGASQGKVSFTPEQLFNNVLTHGYTVTLSNDWKIVRRRVARDQRIEIIGPAYNHMNELRNYGVFTEQINWKTRFFIPVDKETGVKAIQEITSTRPVVTAEPPTTAKAENAALAEHLDTEAFSKKVTSTAGTYRKAIQDAIDPIIEKWENCPDIILVENEYGLPGTTKDAALSSPGIAQGVFVDGKIYLIGRNIDSPAEAQMIILHEVIGHYGLRNVFGKDMDKLLKQTYGLMSMRDRKKIAHDYGLDLSREEDQYVCAEEYIAFQTGNKPSLWAKFVSIFKAFLRRAGFTIDPNEQELKALVDSALRKAREFVYGKMEGKALAEGMPLFRKNQGLITDREIDGGKVRVIDMPAANSIERRTKILLGLKDRPEENIFDPTSTSFEEARRMGREYYEALKREEIYSPAFHGERVLFTDLGWDHVAESTTDRHLSERNIIRRLALLEKARAVIKHTPYVDEIRDEPTGTAFGLLGRFKDGSAVRVAVQKVKLGNKEFLTVFDLVDVEKKLKRVSIPGSLPSDMSSSMVGMAPSAHADNIIGTSDENVNPPNNDDGKARFQKVRTGNSDLDNKSLFPEVQSRVDKNKGIRKNIDMKQKALENLTETWHSWRRHFPHLDPNKHGEYANILRLFEAIPESSKHKAETIIKDILGGLNEKEYDVFSYNVILEDMMKDLESGLLRSDNLKEGETLPFGYKSKDEVQHDLDHFRAQAEKSQEIKDALAKRAKYVQDIRENLVKHGLLDKERLSDPAYFHHQVLEMWGIRKWAGTGTSTKDVRTHRKGWQIARTGSLKDYNTDYIESEFEVLAQGIAQIETKKTLDRIDREGNIIKSLRQQARRWNESAALKIFEDAGMVERTEDDETGEIIVKTPFTPFEQKIAIGFKRLQKMAENEELEGPTEYKRVIDDLAAERDNPRTFEYLAYIVSRGDPGAKEAAMIFKGIKGKEALIKETLGDQLKTFHDLIPEGYRVWKPEPGSAWYLTNSITDKVLEQIRAGEKGLDDPDVRKVLARGVDTMWVLPQEVADTLDDFRSYKDEGPLGRASTFLISSWKQWVLINPMRVIKYNVNNMSGDFDICWAYDPKIIKDYMYQAGKDLFAYAKNKPMSRQMQQEIDNMFRKGIIGSGMTVQDIPDITDHMALDGYLDFMAGRKPNLISRWWNFNKKWTTYRENILRVAAYRYFRDRISKGEKVYGASNQDQVDQIKNPDDRAALLARELVGDYGNLTASGQWLRQKMIPFWSFQEINAPRYIRLFYNLPVEGRGRGALGQAIAMGTARKTFGLATKALTLYGMVMLWNMLFFSDYEKELSEFERRGLHLILGKRPDGSIISIRFQGALSEALSWVGLDDFVKDIKDVSSGRKLVSEQAKEMAWAGPNKIVNAAHPFIKAIGEQLSGYTVFPDITHPRPIKDKMEHLTRMFSLEPFYRHAAGKPTRGDWTKGQFWDDVINVVGYSSDPGEAAYFDTRERARVFLERQGIGQGYYNADSNSKSMALYNYKKALQYGDLDVAQKYLEKYKELGGSQKGLKISVRLADPRAAVPKKMRFKFLNSLNSQDRQKYYRAIKWYNEVYRSKTAEE
jgi:tRNA G10  N-methylase Trm11